MIALRMRVRTAVNRIPAQGQNSTVLRTVCFCRFEAAEQIRQSCTNLLPAQVNRWLVVDDPVLATLIFGPSCRSSFIDSIAMPSQACAADKRVGIENPTC
jgi:hypothetical protein